MKCPSEVELNEFAEDRLESRRRWEVQEHLNACPGCRTDLEGLEWVSAKLELLADESESAALQHPADEDLAALAEGKVSPEQKAELLSHIGVCAECASIFGSLPRKQKSLGLGLPRHWQTFSAAAALLVAIGIFAFSGRFGLDSNLTAPVNLTSREGAKSASVDKPVAAKPAPAAVKPSAKPAAEKPKAMAKPAVKPLPKPVVKPALKPVVKPATTIASKPLTAPALKPVHKASKGASRGGRGHYTRHHTVALKHSRPKSLGSFTKRADKPVAKQPELAAPSAPKPAPPAMSIASVKTPGAPAEGVKTSAAVGAAGLPGTVRVHHDGTAGATPGKLPNVIGKQGAAKPALNVPLTKGKLKPQSARVTTSLGSSDRQSLKLTKQAPSTKAKSKAKLSGGKSGQAPSQGGKPLAQHQHHHGKSPVRAAHHHPTGHAPAGPPHA